MVKFTDNPANLALIEKIAERCKRRFLKEQVIYKPIDIEMDLGAAVMDCPAMNLQALLDAEDFDFLHDILGIRRHLNRKTGKLEDCFLPRCARLRKATT